MASYRILWKNSVEKELRKINRKQISHILEAIEELSGNPFNLPLWSRDNVDNPALEEALQRVAFTQVFGNSEDVALATNVGEI